MKQGWEEKNLGEVCVVERGSSPRPIQKYQTDNEDGVNWIKIGDTKGVDKYITKTKEKITKEEAEKLLTEYLAQLGISYAIMEDEKGVIPMSSIPIQTPKIM